MKIRLLSAAVLLLASASAFAHDFWIGVARHRVAVGDTVAIPLRVGEEYVGEPVARDALRIEKFVVIGPKGTSDVAGDDGKDPAGNVTLADEGIHVVAYRSKRRSIELEAAKFEEYLREEGLLHVVKARADAKQTERPGREVYSRCAKTLIRAGDSAKEGFDRVAGLRLEVVPETNVFSAVAGDEVRFRVEFEKKALAEALVVARSAKEPKHTISARTDAEGRVRLALDRDGAWMVKCVHMLPAPAETGMDWESLWASVTFDILPAPDRSAPRDTPK